MIDQARKLNPEIAFRVGNMMALDVGNERLAGIVAFYAIVNIPESSLSLASAELKSAPKNRIKIQVNWHRETVADYFEQLGSRNSSPSGLSASVTPSV
jgi:hypothetical protein